jgi:predicted PurR-regulated permease PerM
MECMTGPRPGANNDPATAEDSQQVGLRGAVRRLWSRNERPAAAGATLTSQNAAADKTNPGVGQANPGVGRVIGRDGAATAGGVGADAGGPSEPAPAPSAAVPHSAAARHAGVPRLLQELAAWSWRLLLVAVVVYLAFRVAEALRLVVLPLMAAMLLTALLQPITGWLRQRGWPPLAATWVTFLAALLVIAGAITLFANRASADYPALSAEVQKTATQVQHSLAGAPFHLNAAKLQRISNDIGKFLSQHKAEVAGAALTGGRYALDFLAGIVLTLFIAFFLLKDGARIWSWLISGLHRPESHNRAMRAGESAWRALVNYMRGTIAVAAIHALFLGLAFWLLRVPLLVPFIVLVFLAAFVPIIGILVVGALACLVALATKGWVAAVILLAVLVLENQIESHLLQPLVVGRIIRLHPLAIILVLAVGAIIAGIPGAIVAVPIAAVITYAWPALRSGDRAD